MKGGAGIPLDRTQVRMRPLATRKNKVDIQRDHVPPERMGRALTDAEAMVLGETVARIRSAREANRPVVMAFGAHTIKNGLGPVLIRLMEQGWLTHLATNGAGIIHDWELAFLGQTSEDVAANVAQGAFGNWEETGFNINLAINVGAYAGHGYGASVGGFIEADGVDIPSDAELVREVRERVADDPGQAGAAADLLGLVRRFGLRPGRLHVPHRWKGYSVQAAARRLGVPFTGHPMFGHDIIYNHPMNEGSCIGRAALRDFLAYAGSIRQLQGGVYLSVGSAVMSPMIFEKSLSMAQNLALQEGRPMTDYHILVVDLAPAGWDWSRGEPPSGDPAYYLRYNKSFSRMGGTLRCLQMDNRDLLLHLWHALEG